MMTIEEYKLLITSQYQNSTKFMSWLEANLGYLDVLFDSFYLLQEDGGKILLEGSPSFLQLEDSILGSPGTVDIDISALEVAYAELTDITVNVT